MEGKVIGKERGMHRQSILVRARPEAWQQLKLIAKAQGVTLQAVMTEAIDDLLAKHGVDGR